MNFKNIIPMATGTRLFTIWYSKADRVNGMTTTTDAVEQRDVIADHRACRKRCIEGDGLRVAAAWRKRRIVEYEREVIQHACRIQIIYHCLADWIRTVVGEREAVLVRAITQADDGILHRPAWIEWF